MYQTDSFCSLPLLYAPLLLDVPYYLEAVGGDQWVIEMSKESVRRQLHCVHSQAIDACSHFLAIALKIDFVKKVRKCHLFFVKKFF